MSARRAIWSGGVTVRRAAACACLLSCGSLRPSEAHAQRLAHAQLSPPPAEITPDNGPTGRPALEPARVGGEAIVGVYSGIAGYFVGHYVGMSVAGRVRASDHDQEATAQVAGVIAAAFATAGGVCAIGSLGDQTGSYGATLLGAGAGFVTGMAVSRLIFGRPVPADQHSSRIRWMEATVEAMLPAIGATIGFNSSRRYK